MWPLNALSASEAQALRGLLFDVDDTILDCGALRVEALQALYRLRSAGLLLIAVTGRPASWGHVLLRQWPLEGVVAENGGVALKQSEGRIQLLDRLSPDERSRARARLSELVGELRQRYPELAPADDVAGRHADYSFDIAEATQVTETIVRQASAWARAAGARVVRSSIQLHVSFDVDDKASGVLRFLNQLEGTDATAARRQFAFVGDSENDAACFAAFRTTFAVRNVRGSFTISPRYVTTLPYGRGFAQVANALIDKRCPAERRPAERRESEGQGRQ